MVGGDGEQQLEIVELEAVDVVAVVPGSVVQFEWIRQASPGLGSTL